MSIQTGIGARIRKLREDRGLKQSELANYLGMTATGYGKLESGSNGLSSEYCIALADYYGVTCDYILRGVPSEHVDLYDQTCLSPKSIDILVEQKKCFNRQNSALKAHEIDKQAVLELIECAVQSYIVNAIIENHELLDALVWAGSRIINQTYAFIEAAVSHEVDGELSLYDIPELDDYRTMLAACRYTASRAFDRFFSELSNSHEFMCCCNDFSQNPQLVELLDSEIAKELLKTDWRC